MTRSPSDIDHLSASSLRMYLECPRRWAAHYLDEVPRSTSPALLKGKAVDIAATENWGQKIATGEDLPIEEAQQIAEDALYMAVDEAGGREGVDWEDSNFGDTLDQSVRMTRRHMTDHAPLWTPVEVQKRVVKRLPDGRDFLGFIDAVTADGELIDVKTSARRMNQGDADRDIQASAYAWLTGLQQFHFARVMLSHAKGTTSSEVVTTTRTERGQEGFAELAAQASRLIDDGVYPRVPGFYCRWCPVFQSCPVGNPNG